MRSRLSTPRDEASRRSPRPASTNRLRALGWTGAAFTIALTCLPVWPSRAEPKPSAEADGMKPGPTGLAGEWVLVDRGRQVIESAFDRALASLNPFIRVIARQRVDPDELVPRRILIGFDGRHIRTTFKTTRDVRFHSPVGRRRTVTAEQGKQVQLVQRFRDNQLIQYLEFQEGRRWNVLRLEGRDRLVVETTIDPHQLDRNIRYQLHYRRAAGPSRSTGPS